MAFDWYNAQYKMSDMVCELHQHFVPGLDGGKFDWVKVGTSGGDIMQCNFYMFLDGDMQEVGSECKLV